MPERGDPGLSIWSGRVMEDFLKELHFPDGYKKYNEMRLNSPVIGAILAAIEQSVMGVQWTYTSDDGPDDPRLELLETARENMSHSWREHVQSALSALVFGFSVFEIVYERVGGQILWRKFAERGQDTLDRWELDESGGLAGFWQRAAPYYRLVMLPIEELVIYRTRSEKNNPEGRSIFRTARVPYYYAKELQKIEAIGEERGLAGLPVITLPEGADLAESTNEDTDVGRARKVVRNIRMDEQAGVVLPPGWGLSLLSTGSNRAFQTDAIIKRYESRILMSTLSQFLLLGQDKIGSLALSSDQTDFFTMSVNATADLISDTHTRYAAPRLLRLSGYPADGVKLEHTPAGDVDMGQMAEFLQKVGGNLTWTTEDEVWLRSIARMPDIDPEVIEAERAEKRAMAERIQSAVARQPPRLDEEEPEEEDELSALDWFAAGNAPDERERQKFERVFERNMKTFLLGQKKRVMKSARSIARG